jgi:hypothetical protein
MRIACWTPKVTDTLRICNTDSFSTQQRLHECVSMLRYAYIACPVVPVTDSVYCSVRTGYLNIIQVIVLSLPPSCHETSTQNIQHNKPSTNSLDPRHFSQCSDSDRSSIPGSGPNHRNVRVPSPPTESQCSTVLLNLVVSHRNFNSHL